MLRTFLALDLNDELLRSVVALIDELRGESLPRARWVAPKTIHVTLRFLGDTDEALVPALGELVDELGEATPRPIELRSTSLLAFPNARRARVLGLLLDDDGVISELAAKAEPALTALGFQPEERPFRPHLTVARFREPADLRRLFATRSSPMAGGRLSAITLYKSDLGQGGPVHTPLARFELDRGAASG